MKNFAVFTSAVQGPLVVRLDEIAAFRPSPDEGELGSCLWLHGQNDYFEIEESVEEIIAALRAADRIGLGKLPNFFKVYGSDDLTEWSRVPDEEDPTLDKPSVDES